MVRRVIGSALLTVTALLLSVSMAGAQTHTSRPFSGAKVNGGTVTSTVKNGKTVLTLSADFVVPDTPDPHWQVVTKDGQVFLLQRLGVKSLGGLARDRVNMSITLPDYVTGVAAVQIYCSWAEAVLGEAPFAQVQQTTRNAR
jgi:hypothetical protein